MLDFGAVVEYTDDPGNEVLLHVSELAWERTENVADVVNMGDVFQVKYLGMDPKTRKEKVSRKALMPRPPRDENAPARDENRAPRNDRNDRNDRGDRNGGGFNRNNDRNRDERPKIEKRQDDSKPEGESDSTAEQFLSYINAKPHFIILKWGFYF